LAIPPRQTLLRIIDKAALVESAVEAGLFVPQTLVVEDRFQLPSASGRVGFPCVVKPVSSIHWRQNNNWKQVGERKAFRADDMDELEIIYCRVSQANSRVLLQEWIPGEVDRILVAGGYFQRGSEPLAYFTARKIIQAPDEFGTGCLVESVDIPELLEPSVRLCRALFYEGIAEIEYKKDDRDGRLKLIEMNVRHWDWHELGRASGVNVTWAAYSDLTGMPVELTRRTTRSATWIGEDTLLRHMLATAFGRRNWNVQKVLRALRSHPICGVFAWSDPLPSLHYSVTELFPSVARNVVRKIANRVGTRSVLPVAPR
jgi:predicted ATP-grasp superfamily ATP-dependent carboligase